GTRAKNAVTFGAGQEDVGCPCPMVSVAFAFLANERVVDDDVQSERCEHTVVDLSFGGRADDSSDHGVSDRIWIDVVEPNRLVNSSGELTLCLEPLRLAKPPRNRAVEFSSDVVVSQVCNVACR